MAQRVILVDDFDESEPAETVSFMFEGVQYEVDLGPANHEEMRTLLTPYMEAGRRVGGRRRTNGATIAAVPEPVKRTTKRKKSSTKKSTTKENAEIRAWAAENGVDVPERGRIPAHVREQYAEAKAS